MLGTSLRSDGNPSSGVLLAPTWPAFPTPAPLLCGPFFLMGSPFVWSLSVEDLPTLIIFIIL